jgi:hypothetical protein
MNRPGRMQRFVKQKDSGSIASMECTLIGHEHYTILTLAAGADAARIEALLASAPLKQQILSVTPNEKGTVIVARGMTPADAILAALAEHGEVLALPIPEKKPFNPWAWRGYTSILGQSLQIASSVKGNGSASDRMAIFGFAALNLVANSINIIFGAQKKPDQHQLRALKQQTNEQLAPFVANDSLPDPDFIIATTNGKAQTERGLYPLLQKYSVSFGEIGLRIIGAVSLSFPITRWKSALGVLRETGSLGTAIKEMRNPNPVTFGAGLITLVGKFTSLAAKEPDPYNPEPPSLITRFRQHTAFRLSSIIEGGAAAWMTHDRFTKQKITIGGKELPDYLGGAGNAVFVGGYGIRLAAPYGTLEVNMPELYAHVAEGLSKVPAEKLPELTAQMAVNLKQHFHDKPITVSDIYSALVHELHTKHHLDIAPPPILRAPDGPATGTHTPPTQIQAPQHAHTERLVAPSATLHAALA